MINFKFTDYTTSKYFMVGNFSEGLAWVRSNKAPYLYGYINKRGKEVIPCQFNGAGYFSEGLANVHKDSIFKNGYINKKGEIVIDCKFTTVHSFTCGVAPVVINEEKHYIDKDGKIITASEEILERSNFFGELGSIKYLKNNEKVYGYINQEGQIFGTYYWAGDFDDSGLALVQPNEEHVFKVINNKFETLSQLDCRHIKSGQIYNINDGMIRFKQDGKFCYFDYNFNIKIPLLFDKARDFCDGMAIVEIGENIGFVNKDGFIKMFSKKVYEEINDFSEGLAAVRNNYGLWGFINKDGREVIPCQFKHVTNFSDGLSRVFDRADGYYYIDKKGNKKLDGFNTYYSVLELNDIKLDDNKTNGATITIVANSLEELDEKKLKVLSVAKQMILENISREIDEEALSIPYSRGLKKN